MSYTPKELLTITDKYADLLVKTLEKQAKEKLDPKAKVRNRGDCVFPAESPKVSDHKDHFPIGDEKHAHNALAEAGKYKTAPPWYKGSLEELKNAVRRKVKSKYPGIDVSEKKTSKKASLGNQVERLLTKYSQALNPQNAYQISEFYNEAMKHFNDLSSSVRGGAFGELNRTMERIEQGMPTSKETVLRLMRQIRDEVDKINPASGQNLTFYMNEIETPSNATTETKTVPGGYEETWKFDPNATKTPAVQSSPAVAKVQTALMKLYGPDAVGPHKSDGRWGKDTAAAVERFKADHFAIGEKPQDVFKRILERAAV